MKKTLFIFATMLSVLPATSFAQIPQRTSSNITLFSRGQVPVYFDAGAPLSQYITPAKPINWGMDVAWNWDVNVKRGINYIGTDVLSKGIGRVSFQPSDLIDANGNMSAAQQRTLDSRLNNIYLTGTRTINLNCDHEVLMNKDAYPNCDQNYANYNNKPNEWYRCIKAYINYCRKKGFAVVSVSPFNEPDYTDWKEGTQANFKEIARLITEDPELEGIRICAGNTLNCDQALSWYNAVKPYVSEGNTHQLAGSFANYKNFWAKVKSDGNIATADELHNTWEAFVGIHYGMDNGIWWGYEGVGRGELCRATHFGKEIAYAEDNSSMTGAAIYKWDDPVSNMSKVTAFLGGSERQAGTKSYQLVSKGRPTFFDGYGPAYSYSMEIPGGTGYQKGQTNAERIIRIYQGEDVPLEELTDGNYAIMNVNSSFVMALPSSFAAGTAIQQSGFSGETRTPAAAWTLKNINSRNGGEFGYFNLTNLKSVNNSNPMYANLLNGNLSAGGSFIAYNAGGGVNEELFCAEYAGNGSWYIRNKQSGLYLDVVNESTASAAKLTQKAFTGHKSQQWRFVPTADVSSSLATSAKSIPLAPTNVKVECKANSAIITWEKTADTDCVGYVVYKSEDGVEWDVIGRMIKDCIFMDNSVAGAEKCYYKVKAVDIARNISPASAVCEFAVPVKKQKVLHYQFEGAVADSTDNLLDAVVSSGVTYSTTNGYFKQGTKSLRLQSNNFVQLPAGIANYRQMTITMWCRAYSSSTSWQRYFDFGNGTDQYMFFTNRGDGQARFVLKNGGDEQRLSTTALSTGWHHIAVTLADDKVSLYIDGNEVASSSDITIRPADFNPCMNFIGMSQFSADPVLNGWVDDFRMYNYPLTSAQVTDVMNGLEISEDTLKGDVDGDGAVTVADANAVIDYYLGITSEINKEAADVDGNGDINMSDANEIVNIYLKK